MTTPQWIQRIRRRTVAEDASDAGFTLIEALVSFVVFAVVATSASVAIVRALHASHLTQQRVEAADVAQYVVGDAIRNATTIAELPPPGKTISSGVGGADGAGHSIAESEQFRVVETIVYDTGGSCSTGTMFTVNVEVYQAQAPSQFLARSDARVACPRV